MSLFGRSPMIDLTVISRSIAYRFAIQAPVDMQEDGQDRQDAQRGAVKQLEQRPWNLRKVCEICGLRPESLVVSLWVVGLLVFGLRSSVFRLARNCPAPARCANLADCWARSV